MWTDSILTPPGNPGNALATLNQNVLSKLWCPLQLSFGKFCPSSSFQSCLDWKYFVDWFRFDPIWQPWKCSGNPETKIFFLSLDVPYNFYLWHITLASLFSTACGLKVRIRHFTLVIKCRKAQRYRIKKWWRTFPPVTLILKSALGFWLSRPVPELTLYKRNDLSFPLYIELAGRGPSGPPS